MKLSEEDRMMMNAYVPLHLRAGLVRYFEQHIRPGDFLLAVLRGDLFGAVHFGDNDSLYNLVDICRWLHSCAPKKALGSNVEEWLASREEVPCEQ